MRVRSLLRRTASLLAVGLVLAACGPRFDPAEIANQPGTTTVEVPLAGGSTFSGGAGSGTGTGTGTTGTSTDGAGVGSTDGLTGGQSGTGGTTPGGAGGGTGGGSGSSGDAGGDGGDGGGGGDAGGGGGSGDPGGLDPGPAPGVTDAPCVPAEEDDYVNEDLGCIYVGVLVPETGAAPVPSDFRSGVSLYFWEKAKAGGTHGRQIQLVVANTDSNTATTTERAQELLTRPVFTIVSLDRLEVHQALGDFMERAGVPHVMVQAPTPYPSGWTNTFTISVDHTQQGRGVAEYFDGDLNVSDAGVVREQTAALKPGTDAFVARARELGMNVAINETINPAATEFSSTVLSICGSGASHVWLYMAPTPAITIMQQAQTQLNCDVTWFANSISWNLDLAQSNPNAPSKSHAFSPWVSVQSPRAATYRAAFQEYNGSAADDLGLASWGLSEVLDSAFEAVGPALGRDSFRRALQNLKVDAYDTWGPIDCTGGPPYVCSEHVAVYDDNDTTWKMVGDFRVFGR